MLFCQFSTEESEKLSLTPAPPHLRNVKLMAAPSQMRLRMSVSQSLQVHGAMAGMDPRLRVKKKIKRKGRWKQNVQAPSKANPSILEGSQLRKGKRCLHCWFMHSVFVVLFTTSTWTRETFCSHQAYIMVQEDSKYSNLKCRNVYIRG